MERPQKLHIVTAEKYQLALHDATQQISCGTYPNEEEDASMNQYPSSNTFDRRRATPR